MWGSAPAPLPAIDLPSLAAARITVVGGLVRLAGDEHAALSRHKLYARGDSLHLIGVHGMLPTTTHPEGNLTLPAHANCSFVWNATHGTGTAADTTVVGFLHLLSPSLRSARPRADGTPRVRNGSAIELELAAHPDRYVTSVISDAVAAAPPAWLAPPPPLYHVAPSRGVLEGWAPSSSPAPLLLSSAFILGTCVYAVVGEAPLHASVDLSQLRFSARLPPTVPSVHPTDDSSPPSFPSRGANVTTSTTTLQFNVQRVWATMVPPQLKQHALREQVRLRRQQARKQGTGRVPAAAARAASLFAVQQPEVDPHAAVTVAAMVVEGGDSTGVAVAMGCHAALPSAADAVEIEFTLPYAAATMEGGNRVDGSGGGGQSRLRDEGEGSVASLVLSVPRQRWPWAPVHSAICIVVEEAETATSSGAEALVQWVQVR